MSLKSIEIYEGLYKILDSHRYFRTYDIEKNIYDPTTPRDAVKFFDENDVRFMVTQHRIPNDGPTDPDYWFCMAWLDENGNLEMLGFNFMSADKAEEYETWVSKCVTEFNNRYVG